MSLRLVEKSLTSKTGKRKKHSRVYNAKHACPFCTKMVSNGPLCGVIYTRRNDHRDCAQTYCSRNLVGWSFRSGSVQAERLKMIAL